MAISFSSHSFAQTLSVKLADSDGNDLADVVIELFGPENVSLENIETNDVEIDQVDKEFVPGITLITAGSRIRFPNSDDILHHVYSFSSVKTFDTPLYGMADESQPAVSFDMPGVVEMGCKFHDWMLAYIYVGESDKMAISDDSGVATIQNLQAGDYRLKVWHSRLSADENTMTQSITISETQDTEVSLSLELIRDRRIRRAPSANRKRYR